MRCQRPSVAAPSRILGRRRVSWALSVPLDSRISRPWARHFYYHTAAERRVPSAARYVGRKEASHGLSPPLILRLPGGDGGDHAEPPEAFV